MVRLQTFLCTVVWICCILIYVQRLGSGYVLNDSQRSTVLTALSTWMQALRSADTSGISSPASDGLNCQQRRVSTVSHQVMPFRFLLQQNSMSECPLHEDISAAAAKGALSPLRRIRRSWRSRKRSALYGVEVMCVYQAASVGRSVSDWAVCRIFMKFGILVLYEPVAGER